MAGEKEAEREDGDGDGGSPFRGLVICVTGLSKEARKQVMEATERLGGTYSPSLHPNCTHLLVHSFQGRKLEHALNCGFRNGLFVVTIGWFVDSVTNCARLHESPYLIRSYGNLGIRMGEGLTKSASGYNSCFPVRLNLPQKPSEEIEREKLWNSEGNFEVIKQSLLSGHSFYIDSDVSAEFHSKVADVVAQEGAMLVNQWFVGCGADYIVCEGSSIQKYLGRCGNIVSPIWFLKTSKERSMQRFVGLSADLAREAGLMLENLKHVTVEQDSNKEECDRSRVSQAERLKTVKLAKCGIRNRRARRLQTCEVPLRPINSSTLLDSICWTGLNLIRRSQTCCGHSQKVRKVSRYSEITSSPYCSLLIDLLRWDLHQEHTLVIQALCVCSCWALYMTSIRRACQTMKYRLQFTLIQGMLNHSGQ